MQKAIRITAIAAVIGLIVALLIYNSVNPTKADFVTWNDAMTLGDKETAEHHFIMYTDIFCPYCDKFSHAVAVHDEEFKKDYIEDKKILFEIRMTDMNYASGHSNNSLPAAEGAYCAAKQDNFWGYYHAILDKLYKDYHSKGIGIDRNSERIPDLDIKYFYDAADKGGLDHDKFVSCMENDETLAEVNTNTNRAGNIVGGGVPYFQFDSFKTSGFAGNFNPDTDWKQSKLLLDAGLESK